VTLQVKLAELRDQVRRGIRNIERATGSRCGSRRFEAGLDAVWNEFKDDVPK
jgi:hypothetical protein